MFAFAALCVASTAISSQETQGKPIKYLKPVSSTFQPVVRTLGHPARRVGGAYCGGCVDFMDQFLNQLLNIILNGGVLGSCSALCSYLNASSIEQGLCNLLCDAVGVEAFITLIQDADLDPVWMCEEIGFCTPSTCTNSTCAAARSVTVSPLSTAAGNDVTFTAVIAVNSPGVGVLSVMLTLTNTADDGMGGHFSDGGMILIPDPTIGVGQVQVTVTTADDDGMGDMIPWPSGVYNTSVTLCEGSCGSGHAGTYTLNTVQGNQITLTDSMVRGRRHRRH